MVDLNALAVFAKVAETKSFSAAAQALQMPLSTVSRRILVLEAQLGVRLLERSTRMLRLTKVGAEIVSHARRCENLAVSIDDIVADRRAHVRGTLRLSASPCLAHSLIAPLIISFQKRHPDVGFEVDMTERDVDLIADGIDLAFRPRSTRDSALVAVKILAYRHQLVASPHYVLNTTPIGRPADLSQHRLLAFHGRSADTTWSFRRVGSDDEEALTFAPYLASNDYAGLVPPLIDGVGVGVLPPVFRPGLLSCGRLIEVMPEWRMQTEDLTLVHLGGKYMPSALRAFKDFAARETGRLLPRMPT